MNDLLHFAIRRACRLYDTVDGGEFTSACLSRAIMAIAGHKGEIDGEIIALLLIGRDDVEMLSDCHYRIKRGC